MNKTFKTLPLVTALAGAAVVAIAQPMGGHEDMMGQERHGRIDHRVLAEQRRADEGQVGRIGRGAGVAVPAALGIPVTHRAHCRGVTFVTGATRDRTERFS